MKKIQYTLQATCLSLLITSIAQASEVYQEKNWQQALVHLYYKNTNAKNRKDIRTTIKTFEETLAGNNHRNKKITTISDINQNNIKPKHINKTKLTNYDISVLQIFFYFDFLDNPSTNLSQEEQQKAKKICEDSILLLYNKNLKNNRKNTLEEIIEIEENSKHAKNTIQLVNSKNEPIYKHCAILLAKKSQDQDLKRSDSLESQGNDEDPKDGDEQELEDTASVSVKEENTKHIHLNNITLNTLPNLSRLSVPHTPRFEKQASSQSMISDVSSARSSANSSEDEEELVNYINTCNDITTLRHIAIREVMAKQRSQKRQEKDTDRQVKETRSIVEKMSDMQHAQEKKELNSKLLKQSTSLHDLQDQLKQAIEEKKTTLQSQTTLKNKIATLKKTLQEKNKALQKQNTDSTDSPKKHTPNSTNHIPIAKYIFVGSLGFVTGITVSKIIYKTKKTTIPTFSEQEEVNYDKP